VENGLAGKLDKLLQHPWKGLVLVLLVMAVLLLRQLGNDSLGYPDADRILMDGVFILDFLKDLPLTRVYDYTINYFAQYPALSIGYRPPFFPFVEALFNGVFGINTWSSRLAILAFMVAGVTAWYKLVARIYDNGIAFWAALLLVTTPFIAKWGWYTMGELPVLSMAMLTGYIFFRYTETERPAYLYAAAFLFSLTVWTKQTAIFLGLWFVLYLLLEKKLVRCLKRRETWIAIALIFVMLAPLAAITLWLGKQNIAQSMGSGGAADPIARLSWANLKIHISSLVKVHLTLPVLGLSLVGLGSAVWKRDRKALYFALLVVSTYVFFTYLLGKNSRYPIFWIPAFSLFAALPLSYLKDQKMLRISGMAVLAVTAAYQVTQVYARTPHYASGYDQAARYVLKHSQTPTVFVDAYNNGYFTYFMRALDPARSVYVLRADKLLSSSSISAKHWLEVHAHSQEDIRKIFDGYGIVYIVVESKDRSGVEIHRELRNYLKTGPFQLVKEIPVLSNRPPLVGQKLLIYRYLEPKTITADYLELRLPVVGQTIRVPMRKVVGSHSDTKTTGE